ncbi:hypothetical protein Nepgr_005201 [Nepenthes gracilis]|uniref:Uncharacterized protein n=1 Tax=Nepenthes gracilis TaxID=150966 RepID=A0AAD3S363_NEPGR|nr:hypothetical protein Nepgr_005201 [Nepenthes gracilis]
MPLRTWPPVKLRFVMSLQPRWIPPLPIRNHRMGLADEQLHSFQPKSLELVIADEDSIIPHNNYFAVIQDSVASEELVESAKAWKITKDFGESINLPSTHKLSVRDDGDRCIESVEILLSRSRMDSQPPPLDAALETGMVVANLDLNPWGGTSDLTTEDLPLPVMQTGGENLFSNMTEECLPLKVIFQPRSTPRPHAAPEDPQGNAPGHCVSIGMLRSKIDAMSKHFDDARLRPDLPSLLPVDASTPTIDGRGSKSSYQRLKRRKKKRSPILTEIHYGRDGSILQDSVARVAFFRGDVDESEILLMPIDVGLVVY